MTNLLKCESKSTEILNLANNGCILISIFVHLQEFQRNQTQFHDYVFQKVTLPRIKSPSDFLFSAINMDSG